MHKAIPSIVNELVSIVGRANVETDGEALEYLSADLSFEHFVPAEVAVTPRTSDELSDIVRVAFAAGHAVVVRGGGMSYTRGHTPAAAGTVMVDTRRLDRILEINARDGYIRVECGATWEQVFLALREQGLRTPYWGPLSGRYATVGGALAQHSMFWGSGAYGGVADCVLGLEVVVDGGRIVRTGSSGRTGSLPFSRHFGPDFSGPFLGDAGLFGIKAVATLRTLPMTAHTLHHSIAVADLGAALACMEAIGPLGIASEIYNLDPFYARALAKAGMPIMTDHPWTVHFSVDGDTRAIVEAGMARVRELAARFGDEIPAEVPATFRADPFGSVESILLGPEGQIWLPIHAVVPFSRADALVDAVDDFRRANTPVFERHGIELSYLALCVGNFFSFEPSFYWHDELGEFRLERISEESRAEWQGIPANVAAREAALGLRRELAGIFDGLGALHVQLAKYYEYASHLEPATLSLVKAFKRSLDPQGYFNPGALGL